MCFLRKIWVALKRNTFIVCVFQLSGFYIFSCRIHRIIDIYWTVFGWGVSRDLLTCDGGKCGLQKFLWRGNLWWVTQSWVNPSALSWHFVKMTEVKLHFIYLRTILEPSSSPLGVPGFGSHCAGLFLAGDVATGLHQPHHPCMCSLSYDSDFITFIKLHMVEIAKAVGWKRRLLKLHQAQYSVKDMIN